MMRTIDLHTGGSEHVQVKLIEPFGVLVPVLIHFGAELLERRLQRTLHRTLALTAHEV